MLNATKALKAFTILRLGIAALLGVWRIVTMSLKSSGVRRSFLGLGLEMESTDACGVNVCSQSTRQELRSPKDGQKFPKIELENSILFSNNAAICRKTGALFASFNKQELQDIK